MSSNKRYIAVLSSNMPHHLDHLAPFASKIKAPLWIDDKSIYELAKRYYPDVTFISKQFDFEEASNLADVLVVSTKNAPAELKTIFSSMRNNKIEIAYLPHGQSDKGLDDPQMRSIQHADIAYLYGDLQFSRLNSFGSIDTINRVEFTGNYRKEYYDTHKYELDQIIQDEIFKTFDPKKKTILYAPTWSNSAFTRHTQTLIDNLINYNVIIKLHPLMEKVYPSHTIFFEGSDQVRQGLRVLTSFPLIYPILARTDIYIGDESAIGYDFLAYNKPMYFLTDQITPLTHCGQRVESTKELLEKLGDTQDEFKLKRESQYKLAFKRSPA